MQLVFHNSNGKISFFVNHGFDASVIGNIDQQLSLVLKNIFLDRNFLVTIVCGKYDREERLALWEDIYTLSTGLNRPWIVCGDFNVVLNGSEKIGGNSVRAIEMEDFQTCIESSDLFLVQFKGSLFTWWNVRDGPDCIFERLDRILSDEEFQGLFSHIEIDYLPIDGSNHAPLLLGCE